jgi:5-methylcytosine-specific restriction endonuclease McrA
MIKIDISDIERIKADYLSELNNIKKFNKKKDNDIQNYWIDNKDRIISANFTEYQYIIDEFSALNQEGLTDFKKYMIGQYEELFYNRKIGTWLAKQLDIKTCPYCNRQYIFTIIDKGIHPEFDHFYSKSDKPYFALSFFNLIPSCPTCNHIKSDKSIGINPYMDDFQKNDCKFVLMDKNIGRPAIISKKDINVGFNIDKGINLKRNKHKCDDNIDVFGLRGLYNEHTDYIEEIIDKAQAYNATYYDSLIQSFSSLGKTSAEIDRYVWGNYIETAEHSKRPLSKLTSDILEELGII